MRRGWIAFFGVMALLGCQARTDPNRFDLVCSGRSSLDQSIRSFRYSIDLSTGEWCEDEGCAAAELKPIVSSSSTWLVLLDRSAQYLSVDRRDGSFQRSGPHPTGPSYTRAGYNGSCERADFTGWPESRI